MTPERPDVVGDEPPGQPLHGAVVTSEAGTEPFEGLGRLDTWPADVITDEPMLGGEADTSDQEAGEDAGDGPGPDDVSPAWLMPADGDTGTHDEPGGLQATPDLADTQAADEPEAEAHADEGPADADQAPAEVATPAAEVVSPVVEGHPPVEPRLVRRSVAVELALQLHAAGARYCFTVPGEAILPLLDALPGAGIRVITTRHESGAAFMAAALAQQTGRPQLVAVSRAVGAANAAVGIHAASQDSAPIVVLAGQVDRAKLGREAFQEADLVRSVGALAAWATEIDDAAQLPAALSKLTRRLSTGRPGPVLLSLPRDVQDQELEVPEGPVASHAAARGPAADRDVVRRVLKLLAASERGVIVAGGGVLHARATKRLVALSEAMAVPVVAAWRRPDVFPNDHPNYLGMAGTGAPATVRQRLEDADVVVFIGARLSEVTTYGYAVPAPGARWAHVDLQPRTAGAGLSAPTVSVDADASRFLDAAWSDLRGAALDQEMRGRREARMAADREAYRLASQVGQGTWDGEGIHPGHLVEILRRVLPDSATITTDAGNMGGWLARGYRFRRPGTFLGTSSGAMGYGLPAAVAASLHDPDRIAVAICGDGGFAMSMMEIETAVREGAHPVVLVLDNERYGTIALSQVHAGRSTSTAELGPIDAAAIARAQGALGSRATRDDEVEALLRDALAARQTAVIHVAVDAAWASVDEPAATLG
jgi:acetolactate synthase I/II/III large subunit